MNLELNSIFKIIVLYLLSLVALYILIRVITKAVANSWFEVKLKKLKEVYYHGEKEEKEKEQSGEK